MIADIGQSNIIVEKDIADNVRVRGIIRILNTSLPNAFVAQRNRAFGFYPTGWGFESLRRHRQGSSVVERDPEEVGVEGSIPSQGTMKIRKGILKRVHMNGQVIRQNKRDKTNKPAITIKSCDGNVYARRAKICGNAVVVQNFEKPLSSGAVAWIETRAEIEVMD